MAISISTKIYLHLFGVKRYVNNNNIPAVEYWLKNNDVNSIIVDNRCRSIGDIEQQTLLIYAIQCKNFDIAKILVEKYDADIAKTVINNIKWTYYEDTNAIFTCLDQIAFCNNESERNDYNNFCIYLISRMRNIKNIYRLFCDNDKHNILHVASSCGILDVIKYIIENKLIDIDSVTLNKNKTAFYLAVENNNINIIKWLHKHLANINIMTVNEISPLYIACNKNTAIATYLKSIGAII